MNKKITQLRWLVATLMLVAAMVMPSVAWAQNTITPLKPTSGDGSSASPYQISTAAELYWFAGLVNGDKSVCNYDENSNPSGTKQNKAACAVLTANIVVNSGIAEGKTMLESLEYDASGKVTNGSNFVAWTPIENYTGTFDGKGYTVSRLYFNDSSKERVGLFGYVDSGGKISNVGVLDSYFLFRMFGGGVCGWNYGEISNCYNSSTVVETSSYGYAGGVCGYNYGGKVLNSYNNGIISGSTNTGGVCGYNQSNGEITNCYNSGTVSGKGETNQIAGVCGYNDINCTISGCYNTGTVSGQNLGGVCGDNYGTVKNCYNTGTVSGQNVCGGVCSTNNSGTITSCYNRGVVNGTGGYVGGICGNIGSSSSTTNCYYDSNIYSGKAIGYIPGGTVGEDVMGKTTAQFKSGEVAYLLNGSTSAGNSLAWYQNIDNGTADSYPLLDSNGHGKVYQCTPCTGVYSNTENKAGKHLFGENDNGFCHNCGAYQPATLTTDQYDINDDGTKDEVYEIGNAGQLYWFAALVNGTLGGETKNASANAKLTADITVNTGVLNSDGTPNNNGSGFETWIPIGYDQNPYTGTFDGQGHTISGLYFNDGASYVGLFRYNNGTIKNVGVVDSYFCGKERVGGVCGNNSGGTITGCYNTGTISGNRYVGGVCGYNTINVFTSSSGTITGCYNTGKVSGDVSVGGVCGINNGGTITNCYYLSGTATGGIDSNDMAGSAEAKTTAQFKSGEVCYLLNNGTTDGTQAWYQNLSAEGDTWPVCNNTGNNTVYYATLLCGGTWNVGNTYANTPQVVIDHDMPGNASLNTTKHIYQSECQREGCDHIGYYATSDRSVEAQLEGGTYKVASFDLADATAYKSEAEFTVTSLTYKRKFYDDKWMAVYVPFSIDCSKLDADYEMATINNFHEYEQEDGTYNVVLEVKRVTKGGTIPALTPCLMRMKTAPAEEVEKILTFENAEFSAAADKSIDCSSVTRYYQFFGTLNGKTGLTAATDFVLDAGKLYKTTESTVLLPQRWYLSATDRTSTPVETASMLRSISINVIGDGEATGIEDIHVNTESGADASGSTGIYDLQGRKINSEPTKGMYIKNGKKFIK